VTDFNHSFSNSSTQDRNYERLNALKISPSDLDAVSANETTRLENATASPSAPSSFNAAGPFSFLSSDDKEKIKKIVSQQNSISGDKFALLVSFVGKSTIAHVDISKEETCPHCCKLRKGLESTKASMIKILSNRYPAQEFLEAFAEDLVEPITDRKMAENPNCPTCQTALDERNLGRRLEKLVRSCYERDQPYHAPSELVYRLRRKEHLRNSQVPTIVAELCVVEPPLNVEPAVSVEEVANVEPTIEAGHSVAVEQETVDGLQKRIKELEFQNETLCKNATILQATHSQELASLDVKIDDLTQEKSRFENESLKKIEEASRALHDLKQKFDEVEAQKEALHQGSIGAQAAYNQELAKKDCRIEKLTKEKAQHEEKSAKELKQFAEDFQVLKKQFEQLETRNSTLQQDTIDVDNTQNSLKETVDYLEQELSNYKENDDEELRSAHNELKLANNEIVTLKERLEEVNLRASILQAEKETLQREAQEVNRLNASPELSEFFAVVDSTEPEPGPMPSRSILSLIIPTTQHAGTQTPEPFWDIDENLALPILDIDNEIDHSNFNVSTKEVIYSAEELHSQSRVLEVEHSDTLKTEGSIYENSKEQTPPPVHLVDLPDFKKQAPRLRWFWKLILALIVLVMLGFAVYKFNPSLFKSISEIIDSVFARTPLESSVPSESPAEIIPTPTTISEAFQATTTQSAETATPFAAPDVQSSESMLPSLFDSPYKVAGWAVLGGTSVVGWHYRGEILNLFGL
jgi:hypothetical protein